MLRIKLKRGSKSKPVRKPPPNPKRNPYPKRNPERSLSSFSFLLGIQRASNHLLKMNFESLKRRKGMMMEVLIKMRLVQVYKSPKSSISPKKEEEQSRNQQPNDQKFKKFPKLPQMQKLVPKMKKLSMNRRK